MKTLVHQPQSLYRQTLGDAFEGLPPVLKRFHEQPSEAMACGTFQVIRGKGWIRGVLATLLHLPPPGERVPVVLHVQMLGEVESWTRKFDTLHLVTRQWLQDGLLMEAAGPMRFGFRMTADATGMRFEFARCWFVGIPLPSALSPQVNATVSEYEEGWWLQVRIDFPLLGMLTRYEGKVTSQC